MSDNLQIVNNSELKFIDIEKESGFINKRPTCNPKPGIISLSVSACKLLEVDKYTHCNISTIEDPKEASRLYFRLNVGETNLTNYLILKPQGTTVRSGATISGTTVLARKVPRFSSIIRKPNKERKIELLKCGATGLMYIPLSPEFEHKVRDLNNPPTDKVIYKITFKGNILNIGETNCLARRLKEKKAEGLNIGEVYYSLMNNVSDDERKDWEDKHISKYVSEFGALPPNNYQRGRQS